MKRSACLLMLLLLCSLAVPTLAALDDSLVAVFAFGRMRSGLASGFAVGDGSYVVTSSDTVTEQTDDARLPISQIVVVSPWTGEAYLARVAAADKLAKLALLKLPAAALPPATIAAGEALARAPKATLGELLSGDEVGDRFTTEISAITVAHKPDKFTVSKWRANNACLTEVKGLDWLFLSKVNPSEKLPKAAVVTARGNVVGTFRQRLLIEGGQKPATFYQVYTAGSLRAFLTKSGVPGAMLSNPPLVGARAGDADEAFQALCQAFSVYLAGAPSAAESAAAAAKLRPKNAVVNMLLGSALANQGKFDDALKAIDAALAIDPSMPDGHLNRGVVLAASGKSAEAEKDLTQAMRDDPKDVRPVLALVGLLLGKDETLDRALTLAKDARRLAPANLNARLALARVLKRKKDCDGAVAELQEVLRAAPKWGDARVALGATYEAAGKPDLAEAEYRKLVELEPQNPDARVTLIEFLISAGKKDQARQEIEALKKLTLQPQDAEKAKALEAKLEGK